MDSCTLSVVASPRNGWSTAAHEVLSLEVGAGPAGTRSSKSLLTSRLQDLGKDTRMGPLTCWKLTSALKVPDVPKVSPSGTPRS